MARKYKIENHTAKLGSLCTDYGEIESLGEEMSEWRDNLESNNMENLPKFEEVSETADTIENVWNELQGLGDQLEEAIKKSSFAPLLDDVLSYTIMVPYKGRGYPRWMRMSNSTAPLRTVLAHLEESLPKEEKADADKLQEIRDLADEIGSQLDELDQVSFPGMY
jgi:hypothetical protein